MDTILWQTWLIEVHPVVFRQNESKALKRQIGRPPSVGPVEIAKKKDRSARDAYNQVSQTNPANSFSFDENRGDRQNMPARRKF
jgi:hypothetical protein